MTQQSEGLWRRLVRRLTSSNAELVSEQLAHDAESAGCQQIQRARIRERVHLRGTVQAITLSPELDKGGLDVDLDDGTGSITLVWMGRRLIPGIEVGRGIDVWGMLTISGGRRVIFNPAYQLAPESSAATPRREDPVRPSRLRASPDQRARVWQEDPQPAP